MMKKYLHFIGFFLYYQQKNFWNQPTIQYFALKKSFPSSSESMHNISKIINVRLHRARSEGLQSLRMVALRHLLKIGQLFKNNLVKVKLSNCSQNLRPVEVFRKFSMTSSFVCFASSVNVRLFEFFFLCFSELPIGLHKSHGFEFFVLSIP